jgi:hypothetical protein
MLAQNGSVASQFDNLPMENLIGGPLQAAATAQGTLANITSDFINNVGLEKDPTTGKLKAKTVDFSYQKPVKTTTPASGSAPAVETWSTLDMNMQVPLLSIVKSPNLQVKSAEVTFNMEVKASQTDKNTNTQNA